MKWGSHQPAAGPGEEEAGHEHLHSPLAGVQEACLLCAHAGQAGGTALLLASHLGGGRVEEGGREEGEEGVGREEWRRQGGGKEAGRREGRGGRQSRGEEGGGVEKGGGEQGRGEGGGEEAG